MEWIWIWPKYAHGVVVIADAASKSLPSICPPQPHPIPSQPAVELRNKTSRHNSQLVILPTMLLPWICGCGCCGSVNLAANWILLLPPC